MSVFLLVLAFLSGLGCYLVNETRKSDGFPLALVACFAIGAAVYLEVMSR